MMRKKNVAKNVFAGLPLSDHSNSGLCCKGLSLKVLRVPLDLRIKTKIRNWKSSLLLSSIIYTAQHGWLNGERVGLMSWRLSLIPR